MFEDITFPVHTKLGRREQVDLLLSKYIELKKFEEITKSSGSLTPQQRRLIKSSKNRKKVLKLIEQELRNRPKPEETYELWHKLKNVNLNLNGSAQTPQNEEDLSAKIVRELENDESDEDDETPEFNALDILKKFTQSFDTSNHWVKSNFLIRTSGLEVLPYENYASNIMVYRQHVDNLKILLHLNVLRRNWDLAYKIFCLLVRIRLVDIRSIWPIGIEILRKKRQQQVGKNESRIFKDERFFEWLASFYVTSNNFNSAYQKTSRKLGAPIWRSGSKSYAPLYIVTSLWSLMVRGEYAKLQDKLNELLLTPPYNIEGIFYFLKAECFIVEAIEMARAWWGEDSDLNNSDIEPEQDSKFSLKFSGRYNGYPQGELRMMVENNIREVEQQLVKVDELGFLYPKDLIQEQISVLLSIVNSNGIDGMSSDSEYESAIEHQLETIGQYIDIQGTSDDDRQKGSDIEEVESDKEQAPGVEAMDFDFEFD